MTIALFTPMINKDHQIILQQYHNSYLLHLQEQTKRISFYRKQKTMKLHNLR